MQLQHGTVASEAINHQTSQPNMLTDRTLLSDDRYYYNVSIAPWSGEEYYSKIKEQIKNRTVKKRSETAQGLRTQTSDTKIRKVVPKMKTVQIQIAPQVNCGVRNQWSKLYPQKMSHQILHKDVDFGERQFEVENSKKCSSIIMRDNPIHFRKTSIRQFPRSRTRMERTQANIEQRSIRVNDGQVKLNKGKDKKSRLFFFQAKISSNVGNRQKMIMKIRNIERGRVERALTNAY